MGKWRRQFVLIVSLVGVVVLGLWASPAQTQTEPTATPDAEGVIYDIVRPDDTLWAVAGRANISLPELLEFNNLSETDFIQPGQKLIIGYGTPSGTTATAEVTATATRPPPTPTNTSIPPPPLAICLLAFNDNNANGERDAGEALQAAVAFTIYNQEAVVANYVTDGISEPHCVAMSGPGEYQITRSIGRDETLTTSGNRGLILRSGDEVTLAFGSYTGAAPTATTAPTSVATPAVVGESAPDTAVSPPSPAPTEPTTSPILIGVGIIGGLLALGAIVIIVRLRRM